MVNVEPVESAVPLETNSKRLVNVTSKTSYRPNIRYVSPDLQDGINAMIQDKVITAESVEDCLNLSYYLYWLRKLYHYGELHEFLSNEILFEKSEE